MCPFNEQKTFDIYYSGCNYYCQASKKNLSSIFDTLFHQTSDDFEELYKTLHPSVRYRDQGDIKLKWLYTLPVIMISQSPLQLNEVSEILSGCKRRNIDVTPKAWNLKDNEGQSIVSTNTFILFQITPGFITVLSGIASTTIHYFSNVDLRPIRKDIEYRCVLSPEQEYVCKDILLLIRRFLRDNIPFAMNIGLRMGSGKTNISQWLIKELKLRAIICVPTNVLVHEWKRRCDEIFGSSLSGTIETSKSSKDIISKNCNVLICQANHLMSPLFCSRIRNHFSMFLFDESHKYNFVIDNTDNTTLITNNIRDLSFPVSIYLSGTPKIINLLQTGPNYVYSFSQACGQFCMFRCLPTDRDNERLRLVKYVKNPKVRYVRYTRLLDSLDCVANSCLSICREELCLDLSPRNMSILILCKYNSETNRIFDHLKAHIPEVQLHRIVRGQTKKTCVILNEMKEPKNPTIAIATIDYFAAGIDIPSLPRLIYATSYISSLYIRQASGRLLRNLPEDKVLYFLRISTHGSMAHDVQQFLASIYSKCKLILQADGWESLESECVKDVQCRDKSTEAIQSPREQLQDPHHRSLGVWEDNDLSLSPAQGVV